MFLQVANFLFDSGKRIFDSLLSDWGIIGISVIASFVLIRVAEFIKRFFK